MTSTSKDWMRSPEPSQAEAEPDVHRHADRKAENEHTSRSRIVEIYVYTRKHISCFVVTRISQGISKMCSDVGGVLSPCFLLNICSLVSNS